MAPILYFDYDGVLHPSDVRIIRAEPLRPRIYQNGRPTDRPLFDHASLLENILEPFPDIRVSLATSLVYTFGYEFSVQQLPSALRARVVGTIWQGWLLQFPPPRRHDAVTIDAEERGVERWLALDDDVEGWPVNQRHLLVAPENPWESLAQPGLADKLSVALELLCSGRLEGRLPRRGADLSNVDLLSKSIEPIWVLGTSKHRIRSQCSLHRRFRARRQLSRLGTDSTWRMSSVHGRHVPRIGLPRKFVAI
jgi:hypothetical protein